jgi:hypothetical protein
MKKKFLLLFSGLLIFFNSLCQVPNYVTSNGLIGWWPFNGNSVDETGNGHDAIPNQGIPTLVSDRNGIANSAYSFSGPFFKVNNSSFCNFNTSSFSISAWICTNVNNGISTDNPIVYYGAYATVYSQLILRLWVNGLINGGVVGKSCPQSSASYNDSLWHHVVLVRDVTALQYLLYIDDSVVSTSSFAVPSNIFNFQNADLYFGSSAYGTPFGGGIDDIGIWSTALKQQDVDALYTGTIQGLVMNDKSADILLFPNPVKNEINLKLDFPLEGKTYEITDQNGKIVLRSILHGQSNSIQIDHLKEGNYTLRLKENNINLNFIKQ